MSWFPPKRRLTCLTGGYVAYCLVSAFLIFNFSQHLELHSSGHNYLISALQIVSAGVLLISFLLPALTRRYKSKSAAIPSEASIGPRLLHSPEVLPKTSPSLTKVSPTLVQSSEGWTIIAISDAPEEDQCEYRTENGARLSFRSSFSGGSEQVFYTLYNCDWKLLHSNGSLEVVPENQRQTIVDRIVLGLDLLFVSQGKKVFDTYELLIGCTLYDPRDNWQVTVVYSDATSLVVSMCDHLFPIPVSFDQMRMARKCATVRITDTTILRNSDTTIHLDKYQQAALINAIVIYSRDTLGLPLFVEK